MTNEQSLHLKNCNAFVRSGLAWLPVIRTDDGIFKTPAGLNITPRSYEWRAATHAEIVEEMDSRGEVPVWDFLN